MIDISFAISVIIALPSLIAYRLLKLSSQGIESICMFWANICVRYLCAEVAIERYPLLSQYHVQLSIVLLDRMHPTINKSKYD